MAQKKPIVLQMARNTKFDSAPSATVKKTGGCGCGKKAKRK
ncbi:hypothetical protein [Paranoxybacillus vitaminiphilus]|nr:hypothetical protein [Anoxybacillus vitaminiphilus]